MKYILVSVEPIEKYPPIRSIIKYLNEIGCDFVICSVGITDELKNFCRDNNIELKYIEDKYDYTASSFIKLKKLIEYRRELWKMIDESYDAESVLWIFSSITLKHLGDRVLNYQYIIHLFELIEQLPYISMIPSLKINLKKICQNAKKVIVCEYNRAHITKVWFDLPKLPVVLPNKPYEEGIVENNMEITHSDYAKKLINSLSDKKIILYQGILDPERPLNSFIDAVNDLGDEYAFVVMSGSKNIYADCGSNNYYFIPFVEQPYHLEITSHAYIGVLSYVPNRAGYSSVLNSIYCAPNKIYEYSKFGIPMIGNNIPGLHDVFEKFDAGVCFDEFSPEEITRAIQTIDMSYPVYSEGAQKLYGNTDIKQIIKEEVLSEKR